MTSRNEEQEMLEQEADSNFTNWNQSNFSYVNMGPAGILQSIIRFVVEKRKLLLPLLIFVLISIGFIVDISHGVRLSKLEESHDYIRSMFDYDYSDEGVDTDILVNIDVLSKYGKNCQPFFCPSNHHYCYCLSEEFSNFQTANRTCVEKMSGQLLQVKDREEESTFLSRYHRSSNSARKNVFWVGLVKREGEEPDWINCTSCDKPTTLKSHFKKIENITHGIHSCLMMTDGILQKYPCQSARLSEWERKYVTYDDDKKPYWFDQELIEHSYGLNALCECTTIERAKAIESDSSPLVCNGHYYIITRRKFLEQDEAERVCAEGSAGSCYLISFETPFEQKCISNLAIWRSSDETMVWIGGKKVSVGNADYKWAQAGCINQDLDFGTTMKASTQCYGFGRAAVGQWMPVLHARSCEDYLPFFCQIATHKLKAAKAAVDKQISLKLIQHLGQLCDPLDCISSYRCYCTLNGRRPPGWKEALITCGLEDMDLVVINDKREYNFITGETKLALKGYVAAHDFHDDKKLTWVNEGGDKTSQIQVDDDVIISNWTATNGGCLFLNRGNPPFVLQNCDIPETPLCEFDVKEYHEKWNKKKDDYQEYY